MSPSFLRRVLGLLMLAGLLAAPLGAEERSAPKPTPRLEVGKVRLFRDRKRVEVDGRIAVQNRAIELFACCEGGKVHESVVVVDCRPSNLNLALLLLNLDDGGQVKEKVTVRNEKGEPVEKMMMVENGPQYFGDPRKPVGDRLIIHLEWKDLESGKPRSVRAEDMIYDVPRRTTMRRVGWTFTGSRWVENPRSKKLEFTADYAKTIMTTYHDPNTILENPLLTGGDDEAYRANPENVPPPGTAVTLVITVPTAQEKAEAKKNEALDDEEAKKRKKTASPPDDKSGRRDDGDRK